MDYYKILGLDRSATKEEIKKAYRKLAMQFHPDKNSQSGKAVRDGAALKFKQVVEAYDVLMDDRKRASYNINNYNNYNNARHASERGGYASYTYPPRYTYKPSPDAAVSKLEILFRFLTTRTFLFNLALASAFLGGTYMIDVSRERLWKMHNSGKSFEEAMESIEKAKARQD